MFRRKRTRKEKKSEIDALVTLSKKMTPAEVQEFLKKEFENDLQFYQRIVTEQKERTQWMRNQPEVKPVLEKVVNFYTDLQMDGYLKKDFSLFERDRLEDWKRSQSREEAGSLRKELMKTRTEDYPNVFRKINRIYTTEYETIITSDLIEPARKICGRRIRNKTLVLNTLSDYKKGKYADLFNCLNPQIRNSIQHQDFLIDPKQPIITFYDRKKPPLILTLDDYSEIFMDLFFLTLAFDVAWFDVRLGIITILLEEIDTVDEFFKKSDYKLVPKEGGLSILDLALLIKSGKYKV